MTTSDPSYTTSWDTIAIRREEVRARRSARGLAKLIGLRPAGIPLLPDLTVRPPVERLAKVKTGAPVNLLDAEDMLRGRFNAHFYGKREAISSDADARGRLAAALLRIAAGT